MTATRVTWPVYHLILISAVDGDVKQPIQKKTANYNSNTQNKRSKTYAGKIGKNIIKK